MRRVVLLAVLVLPMGLAPLQADAAGSGVVTLAGSRSGYYDMTVRNRTSLDLTHVSISARGRVGGFYVERVDVPPSQRGDDDGQLGAVAMTGVHAPDGGPVVVPLGVPTRVLSPGRYRWYLLADAATTVRIPGQGLATVSVRPARPALMSTAQDSDILASPVTADNVQRLVLSGSRSVSVSTILLGRFRAYQGDVGACLRRPETECGEETNGAGGTYNTTAISPLQDFDFSFSIGYGPGVLGHGSYEAFQTALNATGLRYAAGGAVTLQLV